MAIDATVAASSTAPEGSKESKTAKPQIKLSVSGIITDLENGLDRTAIATKYDLSTAEVNEVFKHPKLKGLRPKRKITRIMLIDDTDSNGEPSSALLQDDVPGDSDLSLMANLTDAQIDQINPDALAEFTN
jgi:hypothetical protein